MLLMIRAHRMLRAGLASEAYARFLAVQHGTATEEAHLMSHRDRRRAAPRMSEATSCSALT